MVVIVVDPRRGVAEDNLKVINALKERCPHLEGSRAGEYRCRIHDEPWYPETPCAQYNAWTSGQEDVPCPMGVYMNGKLSKIKGREDGASDCDDGGVNDVIEASWRGKKAGGLRGD